MDMRVSIEQVAGLQRRIRVQVPESGIEAAIDKRLRELSRSLRLKGFRPGRIPEAVIQQRYGTETRRQVLQEFLQRTCREAIKQQNFEAVGPAEIEQEPTEKGDDLAFVATFEIYPEFQVRGIENLAIDKPVVTITQPDIDELVQRLRKRQRTWRAVDRPARRGDRVTIDFEGEFQGQPVSEARGNRVPIMIGETRLRDDVTSRLMGVCAGATLAIDIAYPESFPDEVLAGKVIRYRISAREVAEECLPDIGPEFCRGFGIESGDVADLRATAEKDMVSDAAMQVHDELRLQLLAQLIDATDIELPQLLCDQEIARLQQQAMRRSGNRQMAEVAPRDLFRDPAARNVRMGLITRQIFREQRMRVLREEVNARIVAACLPGEDVEAKQNWYADHPEMIEQIEHAIIDDKVVDWLMQRATITEKPMTFVEFVEMRKRKWSHLIDASLRVFR